MPIRIGKQSINPEEIKLWQEDAIAFFSSKSELMETDETSLKLGVAKKRVLAQNDTKVLYNIISSTRDHITAALTVNATGEMAPPCCFLWGVRNIAAKHLAGLS